MRKRIWFVVMLLSLIYCGCKEEDEGEKPTDSKEVVSGTVNFGSISIEVPDAALESPVSMTAKAIPAQPYEDAIAAVEFGPDGTEFLKPVTVTMPLEKTVTDGVIAVFYHDKQNNAYRAVDFVEATGNMVNFHVNHFSSYLLIPMTQADYEALTSNIRNDVKTGKNIYDIANKYFDHLVKTDNYFNRWTMIDGRYYKANLLHMDMFYKYNSEEHQAVFSLLAGPRLDNVSGRETSSNYMFTYEKDDQINVVDQTGKTKQKLFEEHQELYNVSVNKEYKIVDPQLEYEVSGKLEKKGDECELTVRLFCEHTGETFYPVLTYDIDGVGDNSTLELVDKYPNQEGKMPWINQNIKLKSTDTSLQLSETTITTDENGAAKVKVTATKDQIKGAIEIVYDYHDNFDDTHVEKSVSFENESDIWELTVDVSGQPHVSVEGLIVDLAYQITATIDMAKMDSFSYGGEMFAQMFVDANIDITKANIISSSTSIQMIDEFTSTYTISNLKSIIRNPYKLMIQPYDYVDGVPTLYMGFDRGEILSYDLTSNIPSEADTRTVEAVTFKVERKEGVHTLSQFVSGGGSQLNFYIGDSYAVSGISENFNDYKVIATMKKVK